MATVIVPPSIAAAEGAASVASTLGAAESAAPVDEAPEPVGAPVAAAVGLDAAAPEPEPDGATAAGVQAVSTMIMIAPNAKRSRQRPRDSPCFVGWLRRRSRARCGDSRRSRDI